MTVIFTKPHDDRVFGTNDADLIHSVRQSSIVTIIEKPGDVLGRLASDVLPLEPRFFGDDPFASTVPIIRDPGQAETRGSSVLAAMT